MVLKKIILPVLLVTIVSSLIFFAFKQANFFHTEITPAKEFKLVESSPIDQDNSFSPVGQPTFVFSKKINIAESDLNKYFQVSPNVPGNWHKEKNGSVIYFSADKSSPDNLPNNLEYNTVYKVSIKKDLYSFDNQHLAGDISVEFRTKQSPKFDIQAVKKLTVTHPNSQLSVEFSGNPNAVEGAGRYLGAGSSLKVDIQLALENQLLSYFKYKNEKFPLYQFSPDSANTHIKSIDLTLQNYNNGSYQLQFDNNTFPDPGIYFVTVSNENGKDDFFVDVTNHINQVFSDKKSTNIWVSDQTAGKSLAGVSVSLYSAQDSPVLLDQVVTNDSGIATSAKPIDQVDFVISHNGPDIAITLAEEYGRFGHQSSSPQDYQVFSYSDRPVYRPGDLVHYKAVIRKKDSNGFTIPQEKFYTQVIFDYAAPDKNNYQEARVDQNGTVTLDNKLPPAVTGTSPQITLSIKKDDHSYAQIDSYPLVVQSYTKPDMDISVTSLEKEYISSDSAHFMVSAKTNFGQPLADIDFSYRVLISDTNEIKDRSLEQSILTAGFYGGGEELTSGTGKFDNQGMAKINFSATLPAKYESSQLATLEITPNIGAAPSIGKIVKLIHRGEFAIFLDNLLGDTDTGITGSVTVLNHHTPRQPIANQPLVLSLYKVIDYKNKQFVKSQNISSGTDGTVNFSFDKVDPGSYEVVVQGPDSRNNSVTTRGQIWVGQSQQYPAGQSSYSFDIKNDKSSYKAGETANLLVKSSYTPTDIVVVVTKATSYPSEIQSITKFNAGTDSFILPIKVSDQYGEQFGVDIFSVTNGFVVTGHSDIKVDKTKKKIISSITFDKKVYKPGETVTANLTTKDSLGNAVSADNSLSVIDASILQIGQFNGDIFDSFYGYSPTAYVVHHDSTTGIFTQLQGGGGGCFLGGTAILMSDGKLKNIEEVKVGDKILTKDSDQSSRLVEDTVVKTFRHAVTDYLTINNKLNVTWIHRIFLNNRWQEAGMAKVGDTLLDESGHLIQITSVNPHIGQYQVYNLETEKLHTFFADGFYVHNDKGAGPRENFVDTAFWNPHIQTDQNGQATVSFKLPDNVTTFTAQVISNTRDSQFGQGIADFVSQKDFNIIPAIANFYYQGDKPVISALIQNSSANDQDVNITLSLKETGFSKTIASNIPKQGVATVTFPIDVSTPNSLSFLIEVKGPGGNILDSVLVKKPILPRGNIKSAWQSFVGSKDLSFKATFPNLDFNTINLWVTPNIASRISQNDFYLSADPSIDLGKKLSAYSYLLAGTRDGWISPTAYAYAKLKNDFLSEVSYLLDIRKADHWPLPRYQTTELLTTINLWLIQGFDQSLKLHLLDQVSNLASILSVTKGYIANMAQPNYLPVDQTIRQWVSNESPDATFANTPESLAISSLNGSLPAMQSLKKLTVLSAKDRYFWDGDVSEAQILPVMAMIDKGTDEDADKAIKGLSFTQSDDPLAILAGLKYAERKKLFVTDPAVKVLVNNQVVFTSGLEDQPSLANGQHTYTASFPLKNATDGQVSLHVETQGDVPVYTTVVSTDFQNAASNNSFQNTIAKFLNKDNALSVDLNLSRTYLDLKTGQNIPEITQGQAGVVTMTANNILSTGVKDKSNLIYSFIMQDAISPSFLYLDQSSGNSPQYQSTLDKIFPAKLENTKGYLVPRDYSDEAAFFDNNMDISKPNFVMPYVVYNVSGGTYFQPKTSLVFPVLGIITTEH